MKEVNNPEQNDELKTKITSPEELRQYEADKDDARDEIKNLTFSPEDEATESESDPIEESKSHTSKKVFTEDALDIMNMDIQGETKDNNMGSESREENNTERTLSGRELAEDEAEVNTMFRGDQFDEKDSYNEVLYPEKRTLDDISVNEAFKMARTPEGRAQLEVMIIEQREAIEADWYGMSIDEYREHKELMSSNHENQETEEICQPEEEQSNTQDVTQDVTQDQDGTSEFKEFLKKADAVLEKVENFLWDVFETGFEMGGERIGNAVAGEFGGVMGEKIFGKAAKSFAENMRFQSAESATDRKDEVHPKVDNVLEKTEEILWEGEQGFFENFGEKIGSEIAGDFGGVIGETILGGAANAFVEKLKFQSAESATDHVEKNHQKVDNVLEKGEDILWESEHGFFENFGEKIGSEIAGDFGGVLGSTSLGALSRFMAEKLKFTSEDK